MPKMTGCCGLNMNAHSTHLVQKKEDTYAAIGKGQADMQKTPIKLVITQCKKHQVKMYKTKTTLFIDFNIGNVTFHSHFLKLSSC